MQWHSSLKAYIPAYSILLDKGLSIRKSIKCRRITTQIEVQLRYILSTGKHYHSSIIKSQVYCVSLEPPAELCFTFRVIILLAHLSRRLIGEPIVYQLSVVRPSVRPSSVHLSSTMLKDLLLRNRWAGQSQILCGASLGRGNDILFAASGSHDQDGRHAHIW